MIRFALTGSEGEIDLTLGDDTKLRGKWAATIWFLLKEGTITKVEGMDAIGKDRRVVANVQRLQEGDNVPSEWIGTEKQVFTRLYLVCDTKEELAECIKEYQKTIKVYDENGADMVLNGFDADAALELKKQGEEGR